MGQSFHWMEQAEVLDRLYTLIEAEGGLVIIGSEPTPQKTLTQRKDDALKETIIKYLGAKRRAGKKTYKHPKMPYKELLLNSKFNNFKRAILQSPIVTKCRSNYRTIIFHVVGFQKTFGRAGRSI
jgi:hypothetical protein